MPMICMYDLNMSVPPILWVNFCAGTYIVGEKGNEKKEQGPEKGGEGQYNPMQESGTH